MIYIFKEEVVVSVIEVLSSGRGNVFHECLIESKSSFKGWGVFSYVKLLTVLLTEIIKVVFSEVKTVLDL